MLTPGEILNPPHGSAEVAKFCPRCNEIREMVEIIVEDESVYYCQRYCGHHFLQMGNGKLAEIPIGLMVSLGLSLQKKSQECSCGTPVEKLPKIAHVSTECVTFQYCENCQQLYETKDGKTTLSNQKGEVLRIM